MQLGLYFSGRLYLILYSPFSVLFIRLISVFQPHSLSRHRDLAPHDCFLSLSKPFRVVCDTTVLLIRFSKKFKRSIKLGAFIGLAALGVLSYLYIKTALMLYQVVNNHLPRYCPWHSTKAAMIVYIISPLA